MGGELRGKLGGRGGGKSNLRTNLSLTIMEMCQMFPVLFFLGSKTNFWVGGEYMSSGGNLKPKMMF